MAEGGGWGIAWVGWRMVRSVSSLFPPQEGRDGVWVAVADHRTRGGPAMDIEKEKIKSMFIVSNYRHRAA
eukprot:scaffold6269_cov113-Isochrysis_galbana.AAC.2